MYGDYDEIEVETSTVDLELSSMKIDRVDLIKIDIQGCELDFIKGIQSYFPLFWIIEIQHLPVYHDVPLDSELITEIKLRGYILFWNGGKQIREIRCIRKSDGYFMPNWNDEKGKRLILNNLENWRALMRMFGQYHILNFVEKQLDIKY